MRANIAGTPAELAELAAAGQPATVPTIANGTHKSVLFVFVRDHSDREPALRRDREWSGITAVTRRSTGAIPVERRHIKADLWDRASFPRAGRV